MTDQTCEQEWDALLQESEPRATKIAVCQAFLDKWWPRPTWPAKDAPEAEIQEWNEKSKKRWDNEDFTWGMLISHFLTDQLERTGRHCRYPDGTLDGIVAEDKEFQMKVLASVEKNADGSYGVTFHDGWSFGVPAEVLIVPEVGDVCWLFGEGIGFTMRGLAIEGYVVFYRTKEQEEERHRQWCEDEKHRKQVAFEANKEDMDKRFAKLPRFFQRRIQRRRDNNPNFRWDFESYELFVCEQAVQIAKGVRPYVLESNARKVMPETLTAFFQQFQDKPYEEQKRLIPALDNGHSGNTFGCACVLAQLWLMGKFRAVVDLHGALSSLVGSEAYGDMPPVQAVVQQGEGSQDERPTDR